MKLTKKQEQILEVLADERKINPKTSLTGIDMKLLGDKVGAHLGIGVMYDVDKLRHLGFVSKDGNRVIITQKGLDYVTSRRRLYNISRILKNKYFVGIILLIALVVSISTKNFFWLITAILSPIISEIIKQIIKPQNNRND